jgi:hypothetical protein
MRNNSPQAGENAPRITQRTHDTQTPPQTSSVAATCPDLSSPSTMPQSDAGNSDAVTASSVSRANVASRRTNAKTPSEVSNPAMRRAAMQLEPRAAQFPPQTTSRRHPHKSAPISSSPHSIAESADVSSHALHNDIQHRADPLSALEPPSRGHRNDRQAQPPNGNAIREALSSDARAEIVRRFSPRPEPQTVAMQAPPPTSASPVTGNPRATDSVAANRPAAPALLEPTLPARAPEPPPRPPFQSAAETQREAQRIRESPTSPTPLRTTVQIGKIEVQVIPPMTTVRPAAPAAQPKERLARGYALWTGR